MAISLSDINISLDQFAAATSGKFNIGQLRLGEDGASVERVNNHKTFAFLNSTKVSAEESFALRSAFVKALSREGVSAESMEQVRKDLGLDKSGFSLVRSGRLQPLSAAQVRTIIDKYAGEINAKRTADNKAAILTRADLFADETAETREARAATAQGINSATLSSMKFRATSDVRMIADLLGPVNAGDGLGAFPKAVAKELLKAAAAAPAFLSDPEKSLTLRKLSPDIHFGVSGPGGKVTVEFDLADGRDILFDTGLTKDEFLRQLENALAANGKVVKPGDGGKWEADKGALNEPAQPNPSAEAKLAAQRNKDALVRQDHDNVIANMKADFAADPAQFAADTLAELDEKLALLKNPKLALPTRDSLKRAGKAFASLPEEEKESVLNDARGKVSSARFEFFKNHIAPKLLDALNVARGRSEENVALLNRLSDYVRSGEGDLASIKNDIREAIVPAPQPDYADDLDENFNINAFLASARTEG